MVAISRSTKLSRRPAAAAAVAVVEAAEAVVVAMAVIAAMATITTAVAAARAGNLKLEGIRSVEQPNALMRILLTEE